MSGTLILLAVVAVLVIGSLLLIRQSRRLSAGGIRGPQSGQGRSTEDPPETAG